MIKSDGNEELALPEVAELDSPEISEGSSIELAQEPISRVEIHLIMPGETLDDVSVEWGKSKVEIRAYNPMLEGIDDDLSTLEGQQLKIPVYSE